MLNFERDRLYEWNIEKKNEGNKKEQRIRKKNTNKKKRKERTEEETKTRTDSKGENERCFYLGLLRAESRCWIRGCNFHSSSRDSRFRASDFREFQLDYIQSGT